MPGPGVASTVVLDERSPYEPDEDVEPPPPDLGPSIPDVEPDVDGGFGPSDAPRELLYAFWSLVLLFNVGLLATSLGAMLIVFRGDWDLGGGLLVVGLLALARGLHRYSRTDPHRLGADEDTPGEDGGGSRDGDGDEDM